MQIIYHPAALAELIEAAKYYDSRSAGLGADFLDEFDRAVLLAAKWPRRFVIVRDSIRRSSLRRFPYAVYYREIAGGIRVLVIKRHSRHPEYGLERK